MGQCQCRRCTGGLFQQHFGTGQVATSQCLRANMGGRQRMVGRHIQQLLPQRHGGWMLALLLQAIGLGFEFCDA
jgi:hypothetical protein